MDTARARKPAGHASPQGTLSWGVSGHISWVNSAARVRAGSPPGWPFLDCVKGQFAPRGMRVLRRWRDRSGKAAPILGRRKVIRKDRKLTGGRSFELGTQKQGTLCPGRRAGRWTSLSQTSHGSARGPQMGKLGCLRRGHCPELELGGPCCAGGQAGPPLPRLSQEGEGQG